MIVNLLGNAIKHKIQNVMISMVIVITLVTIVSLLGDARLNIVRLDPLAQPLHRAVAVERIWSQSPKDNEDFDYFASCENFDSDDDEDLFCDD